MDTPAKSHEGDNENVKPYLRRMYVYHLMRAEKDEHMFNVSLPCTVLPPKILRQSSSTVRLT